MLTLDETDLTIGDIGMLQAIVDVLAIVLREKNRSIKAWTERDSEKTDAIQRMLEEENDRRVQATATD